MHQVMMVIVICSSVLVSACSSTEGLPPEATSPVDANVEDSGALEASQDVVPQDSAVSLDLEAHGAVLGDDILASL